jgi:hypothetical protein
VIFPFSTYIKRALGASWKDIMRLSNDPRFMKEIIPSVNMVSTADEMSRFFQLLLNRGELEGVRVFEPITIRRATMEAGKTAIDRTVMLPMRYTGHLLNTHLDIWDSAIYCAGLIMIVILQYHSSIPARHYWEYILCHFYDC